MLLDLDPSKVPPPGWIPLLLVIGLAVVIALLYLNMRHNLRKISVPTRAELEAQSSGGDVAAAGQSRSTPPQPPKLGEAGH